MLKTVYLPRTLFSSTGWGWWGGWWWGGGGGLGGGVMKMCSGYKNVPFGKENLNNMASEVIEKITIDGQTEEENHRMTDMLKTVYPTKTNKG